MYYFSEDQQSINNEQVQQLVEEISLTFFDKAFRHRAFFNSRLRTVGGRYHLQSHSIDLNPKVFEKYGEQELIGVIKHELCHYHLHLESKGYRHRDQEFKQLLKQTGGNRYVKPLETKKERITHYYYCETCQTQIVRRRRINTEKFVCATCRSHLVKMEL